jgi:hypothetical protein
LAELSIAAIWLRALVRSCVGASSVDSRGSVEVWSVQIILTRYANERE